MLLVERFLSPHPQPSLLIVIIVALFPHVSHQKDRGSTHAEALASPGAGDRWSTMSGSYRLLPSELWSLSCLPALSFPCLSSTVWFIHAHKPRCLDADTSHCHTLTQNWLHSSRSIDCMLDLESGRQQRRLAGKSTILITSWNTPRAGV